MTDITDLLHVGEVDDEELLTVLLGYFGNAEQVGDLIRFRRQRENGSHHFSVLFGKNGNVQEIRAGPNFPAEEVETIKGEVEKALVRDQRTAIAQRVCFSERKMTGFFKYSETLQILPVPDHAPKARGFSDYPFLVQCVYTWCDHLTVRQQRAEHQARRYVRFLNLLSNTRIHMGPMHSRHFWVLHSDPDPSKWISAWEMTGYTYPGFSGELQEYADASHYEPIQLVKAEDYYRYGVRVKGGKELTLPDDIKNSLDIVLGLDGERRRQFERAAAYFDQAETVWWDSNSLGYVALVTALESLMEKPERCESCNQSLAAAMERCDRCNQPRYRTTRQFMEFLETYAPDIGGLGFEKDVLYGVRSDLAHGNDVMDADMMPLFLFSTRQLKESRLHLMLQRVAATAIVNWLRAQVGSM
jgi:hypothetical protein